MEMYRERWSIKSLNYRICDSYTHTHARAHTHTHIYGCIIFGKSSSWRFVSHYLDVEVR